MLIAVGIALRTGAWRFCRLDLRSTRDNNRTADIRAVADERADQTGSASTLH